jgi:hypothetical protein
MRNELAERGGERATYRGVFQRYGMKNGWKGSAETTVLLAPVADANGHPVCDHLWFNLTKQFADLDLLEGDIVEFAGRVVPYTKGYQGRRDDVDKPMDTDYKLSRPTNAARHRWRGDSVG